MASNAELDSFITDCETLLRCQYVRPECAKTLSPATPFTRYLFPMSLDALGVHAPDSVVQLVLVANTSPRWLWEEVREAFEAGVHKVSIVESKTHPTSSAVALPRWKCAPKALVLRAEVGGQIVLLEYCQHIPIEGLVDGHGHFEPNSLSGSPLTQKAHYLQRIANGPFTGLYRTEADRCLRWAHDLGMLSERLDLLSPEQVFAMVEQPCGDQVDKDSIMKRLWDVYAKSTNMAPGHPNPRKAQFEVPDSPGGGFELFAHSHSQFVLLQLHCWAAGMRLLFADDFFDVLAAAQHDIQASGSYGARVWPFHLTERTAQDGVACFLIGIWRTGKEDDCEPQESTLVDKVSQLVADLLQKQMRPLYINDEYSTQVSLIDNNHYIFANSNEYLQRHASPVRGLPSATLLPKVEGDASSQISDPPSDTPRFESRASDETWTTPTTFRTEKKILDQLRWDATYAGSRSYEVGYVDRFSDTLMWLPTADWVQTTEEEDFIPLHRIRQFRNIVTKEVIWDRALRIDRLK